MIDIALDNKIFVETELDAAIQELDLMLNTECTELIGDTQFGLSIDQFLWTLTPTTEEFNQYIESKLEQLYYFNKFKHKIYTEYDDDDYSSIYKLVIEIYIDEVNYIKKEYTYK